ncbi:vacuole effluxer Atg22 like-domain-containing protein [Lactarius quietus]|nr:vacuole effluxer Atg22 like-domain-containing protein [Lactarius quietus]
MSHAVPTEHHLVPELALLVTAVRKDDALEDIGTSTSEVPVVAPPSYHEPVVTRRELWSYYLYYNGDNGVGPIGYSMTLFQSLATAAGYDPVRGPGSSCLDADASGKCVMTILFTTIGSAADYRNFGRWLLFVVTLICWAAQFASMSLTSPSRWGLAMALYMIGFISYGATLVFYAAIFPRLARNTQHSRDLRERYDRGEISAEVYEQEESLEKNRISNISTTHSNIGYIMTLALNLSLLLPLKITPNFTNDDAYTIWVSLKQYKELPNTFIFLFAFFLLADGLNTTGTLVSICQNDKFAFSTLGFWYIQRIGRSFVVTNVVTILIPLWGMIGIWTDKFGFHNAWEFWAYNVVFGLFQAPYYAFSQTMMAELSPPGFDNMFFGLFGLSNRASSMIGPNVIQAVIDNTGNNWDGFPFLFALCASASLVIWFAVDVQKGRRAAVRWAAERRGAASVTPSDEIDGESVGSGARKP